MDKPSTRRAFVRTATVLPSAMLVAACGGTTASPTSAPAKATTAPSGGAAGAATATTAAGPTGTAPGAAATKPAAPGASPAATGTAAGATAAATKPAAATTTGASPAAGSTQAAGAGAVGTCVLTPEQTEGPYYIDTKLVRSDITEGKAGVPLNLTLTVQDPACKPIQNATVEIWHCDATGVYSGFGSGSGAAEKPGGPPGGTPGAKPSGPPPSGGAPGNQRGTPTNAAVFLRGGQVSAADGKVTFKSVYPGWYQGRTPHIHVKVFVGGNEVHTGQLYFDEAVTKSVYATAPYNTHQGQDTTNATDSIFRDGGDKTLLALTKAGDGYSSNVNLQVK